ncbi:protein phosphatase 2C domain-containing protein [Streptomyces sp. NPDC047085]|uniref:protein phosphatase 2C domain-containing protein n=1 Tax=Streptomyces sp. NPDC047085 TaxID=3155140 RepID=UPI0033FCE91D
MSQQGGRPARREDDWWGQLYDDSTEDTGPTAAPDSLDDRFASAKSTVAGAPSGGESRTGDPVPRDPQPYEEPPPDPALPPQRAASPPASAPDSPPASPSASAPGPPSADPFPRPIPPRQRAPWEPPSAEPTPPGTLPPATPPPTPPLTSPELPEAPASATPHDETVARPEPPELPAPAPLSPPLAPSLSTPDYVGSGPPTYDPEPTALPGADPDELGELVADTVLDGARYGACTLRAVSLRGDSARYRGEPRRDALLTARFGVGEQALVLVAMATGARATPGAHRAAAEACRWIGQAVGRSHQRLVEDLRAARRGELKSGLHRLTDRSLGKLRAGAVEQDLDPEEYTASLRCLLLPADPDCRTRVFFGAGDGGLFRLREGEWQDIEPRVSAASGAGEPVVGFGSLPAETPEGDRLTMDLGIPTPPSPYEPAAGPGPAGAAEPPREPFRFRASVARPGDVLVMCSGGLAEPLRGEPALCAYLAHRWSRSAAPGLAAFLADTQVRVKGYADDRTAAAVWEA